MINGAITNNEIQISNFFDQTVRTWKKEAVCSTFCEANARSILKILLFRTELKDLLIWRGEATGVFFVRSGYKILLES